MVPLSPAPANAIPGTVNRRLIGKGAGLHPSKAEVHFLLLNSRINKSRVGLFWACDFYVKRAHASGSGRNPVVYWTHSHRSVCSVTMVGMYVSVCKYVLKYVSMDVCIHL